MDKTAIQWTDATWNPTRGCRRIGPGCINCYAEKVAARFCGDGLPYEGLIKLGKWNGEARFVPDKLDLPLRWRKPRRIFVDSMSDLFYEGFSDECIDQVLAVMLLSPQHTFQVLTKRAERMARYLNDPGLYMRILEGPARELRHQRPALTEIGISNPAAVPAKWIWWGVSVEDQQRADERIPHLLRTPAAVRFVSYEPALGAIDFERFHKWPWYCERCQVAPEQNAETHLHCHDGGAVVRRKIDWLIVGGESGRDARPFDIAWARSAVAQCKAVGVPVFVKQLSKYPYSSTEQWISRGGPCVIDPLSQWTIREPMHDPKGGDMSEWPEDLRVREWPAVRLCP